MRLPFLELEYLLRVIVAGLCGALIGYERKNRNKEAGIRTHFVVAIGASLMMVVSKYGFQDQLHWENLSLDPSRIAAQVVSGVGFLGAGMIFLQRQTVKGLTTAAGIWASAGMAMAIGAGSYVLGVGVTILILIGQKVLHSRFTWLNTPKNEHLTVYLHDELGALQSIRGLLEQQKIALLSFHAENHTQEEIVLEMSIRMTKDSRPAMLLTMIQELEHVKSVELH
ncbi:MgtC/SapB family protein [Paenibacillaceae bacterium]|nr:MgtC/SapB family protein [Paenibacillaceae bacterium]